MRWLIGLIAFLSVWVSSPYLSTQGLFAQTQGLNHPRIFRLDRNVDRIIDGASSPPTPSDIRQLAKVIAQRRTLYARLGYTDPALYAKGILYGRGIAQDIAATRAFFADRNLTAEVRTLYQSTLAAIGLNSRYPVNYYLAYGLKQGTNAQTQSGDATPDGRTHIYLNLVALATGQHWPIAVVHETVHTLQPLTPDPSLLALSMVEGVPTYLSQVLHPHISDAEALFWSPTQWQAAEARREAIIQTFAQHLGATSRDRLRPFIRLHVPLRTVPGAPDRTGYYVGFLAVKAWVGQHPHRPLRDLFAVPPEEFWQALMATQTWP